MASHERTAVSIESLIEGGAIVGHKDGNHGSNYPRVNDFGPVGVPFLTAKSIENGKVDIDGAPRLAYDKADALRFGFVEPGDVLLSHNATVGRVAVMPNFAGRVLIGTSLTYFRANPSKLLPRYLAAYFSAQHFQDQLAAVMSQTTRNQVPITAQKQLRIILPDLSEQTAIAHILGTLDEKIELNRRINETLEAMARAIFKSWFADFDPVRAKADGRDPCVPNDLANLFPEVFEDSDLGEIPKGWEVQSLHAFATLNPESWSKDTCPEILDYIDLSNTKWGRIEEVVRYEGKARPSRARRILRPRDTVVGTVRPGNGSYALIAREGLTGSTGFAALRPRRAEYTEFVYLAATARENIEALAHLADGGAYPAVRPEVVVATRVPKAPNEVYLRFAQVVRPLLGKFAANESQSHTLSELRNALLPKLISGEIRLIASIRE